MKHESAGQEILQRARPSTSAAYTIAKGQFKRVNRHKSGTANMVGRKLLDSRLGDIQEIYEIGP